MRLLFAALVAVLSITASVALAASSTPDGAVSSFQVSDSRRTYPMSFDGLNEAARAEVDRRTWLEAAMRSLKARQDAEAAARAAEARQRASARQAPTGAVSGTCAAMKPAGFPDSIIMRESGGNPEARNASSGAYGCAQIMPFHFSRGSCVGLDYAACWAKLWAGGAGAGHWACRADWGCGG